MPETSDTLLSMADQEEALSRIYALAVAARAGYTTAEQDFDRDGVDLTIKAGGSMRPAIDLQIKASTNLRRLQDGSLRYDLNVRNYQLLRETTQTPRYLMVLELPKDTDKWISISQRSLILRRRAFWVDLLAADETDNKTSVAINVPAANLFDVANLRHLMAKSRSGDKP